MTDKELLKLFGLDDKRLELEVDIINNMSNKPNKNSLEYDILQNMSNKYSNDLKQQEDKKKEFIELFNERYVYDKIKNKLIQDGFIYQCKFCWGLDVSGQYGKRHIEK